MLVKQRETLPRRRFGKVILVKLFHPLSRDNQIYLNVGFKKPNSPLPGYHRPFKFFILRGTPFCPFACFRPKLDSLIPISGQTQNLTSGVFHTRLLVQRLPFCT